MNLLNAQIQSEKFKTLFIGNYYLYLLFLLPFSALSQPINNFTKGVSIVNPNAASLGKYTDIPVSLSTGVPSISIPIHTINEGSLSLPITLGYLRWSNKNGHKILLILCYGNKQKKNKQAPSAV